MEEEELKFRGEEEVEAPIHLPGMREEEEG